MPKNYFFRAFRTLKVPVALFFILSLLSANPTFAQLDTEFWFAPPELTESTTLGTGGPRDRPIQLVVSTLEKSARIEILQPADLTFIPIVVNLPANSTQIVNLTPFIDRLESKPANTILKTGLLIRSTNSISAYYEIKSSNNTDIFALKGANANGKKFYVPFQTHWNNATNLNGNLYTPTTYASFDIVATDDSTFVTVTPTKPLIGHPAGVPFTFRLDRGQVYSCRAADRFGANHPAGSKIEATKEVAVTMKDDMLQFDITEQIPGADVAGDQLIPVDFLGNTYVLVKGGLNNNEDRCFIVATEDNTIIRVDGNAIPLDTLNEGEQHEFQMINSSYFLSSNKKVGVLHISGIADQVGGAIIPALSCTGTNRIGFTRTNASQFIVNVITKNSAKNNFTLNDNPNLVPGSAFQPILGSNGWVFARITFSTSQIPAGTTLLLQNSGDELFHVGVTNYAAGVGSNYGYFSNFSRLNLGTNKSLCIGDTAILDAGPAKTSYLWNTGAITRTILTQEPGKYWVNTLSGSQCPKSDTVRVRFYAPTFTLGPDDTICIGATRLIQPSGVFTYTWQNGSTQQTFLANSPGIYWAQVADFQGCTTRDSINIAEAPRPQTPIASEGDTVCFGSSVSLSMGIIPNATYAWLDPDSILISGRSIVVNTSTQPAGVYKAFIKIDGCESLFDTALVGVIDSPVIGLGKDTVVCSASGTIVIDPGNHLPGLTYLWSDNTADTSLTVTQSGKYKVKVTNGTGCFSTDSINVLFQTSPNQATFSGPNTFCSNQAASFGVVTENGYIYQWSGPNGFSQSGPVISFSSIQLPDAGSYSVTPLLNGCPSTTSSRTITVNLSPAISLGKDSAACAAFGLTLDPIQNGSGLTYLWSTGSTDSSISVTTAGSYSVAVSNGTCTSRDTVQLSFGVGPTNVQFAGVRNYCEGANASFGVVETPGVTYSWSGPGGFSFNGPTIQIPVIQLNQAGTYTVTPSFPGCPGQSRGTQLVVRPSPIINPMKDTSFCAGSSINLDPVLNGGEETFYSWNNGQADSVIAVSTIGQYSVIATFGLCQAFDTVVVGVRPIPGPITLTGDTTFCAGENANLSVNAQNNVSYNWSGPNGFTANGNSIQIPNVTGNQFGTYFVTATLGSCSGLAKTFSITQESSPVLSLSDEIPICNGSSVLLDPVLFGNGFTYSWNTGSTDSSITVSSPGKYTVSVSNGNCSTIDSVNVIISISPNPAIIAGLGTYCKGDIASFSVTAQTGVNYQWSGPNGFTANSPSVSLNNVQTNQAGEYIVIPELSGCTGTPDTISVTVGITPTLSFGADEIVCNTPTRILDPISNSEGFSFVWSTGSTDTSLIVSISGTYVVTVSNGTCSSKDTINISFGTTPNPLVISGVTSFCRGENAAFSILGQTGVVVSWTGPNSFTSNGNSIALNNIQPNQAGQYIVNSSSSGCTGTGDTVLVSVGNSPVIELGVTKFVCNGSSVTLDPILNGAGLTYSWNTGSTDSSLVVTLPGNYNVVVSDGGICTSTDSVIVNAGSAPNPVTIAGDTTICLGNQAQFIVPVQPGVSYSWTGPNGFTASTDTIKITNAGLINSGIYTVIPTLGNCPGGPTSINLTVGVGPIVYLGIDDTICGNIPVILDPTNGQSGFTYDWNVGSTDSSIVINQTGQYAVTVSFQGCIKSDTVNLTFNPLPLPVTIEGDQAQCAGDTILLTLQGTQLSANYLWTGPGGFTTTGNTVTIPNITLLNAGQYQVKPLLDGCAGTATFIDVAVNTRPFAQLGLDIQTCEGTSFILDPNPASAGLTFSWNTGSTDTSLIVSTSGVYIVEVKNGTNCSTRDTINITFQPFPGAPQFTGDTVFCQGESGTFGVQAQVGASANWIGPNGFTSTGETILINNATTLQNGYYSVKLNNGSCFGQTDSVFVKVSLYPIVNLGRDSSFCGITSYTLDGGSGTQDQTYQWNTGSLNSSVTVSLTGQYSVKVTNGALCSNSDTVNLVFKSSPDPIQIIQGSKDVCENRTASFEIQDQPMAQISWTGPNGFTSSGNLINVNSTALTAGTYTVVNSLDGCPGTPQTMVLGLKSNPTLTISYDSLVCTGTKKAASALTSTGANILWSNNVTGASTSFGVGLHWAETSLNGCSLRDSFLVRNSGPIAAFSTVPDSNLIVYETVQFLDKSIAGLSPITNWEWQLGNSQIRTDKNTSYTYSEAGEVDVQLIVKDNLGCSDTLVKTITLIVPRGWFIPNLFTPNGDGDNDFFEIGDLSKYPGTKVHVYNRWGNSEYTSSDYQNNWDGGSLVEGIYYFSIVRSDGQKYNGYINLKR